MDEKRGTPVARRAIIGCQATVRVVGRIGLRRDCHPMTRTHDFRFRGRVRLPIVTNWPRARRIGDNRKTYASLRVRVTQAESTHESTSNGRTWLRATSQARGVITSPSRRGGRVNMRHGPGASGLSCGARRQAERPRPGAPARGRVCTRRPAGGGSSRRTIQGLKSPNLPRRCSESQSVARSGPDPSPFPGQIGNPGQWKLGISGPSPGGIRVMSHDPEPLEAAAGMITMPLALRVRLRLVVGDGPPAGPRTVVHGS
jgi:hypothetical protein